MKGIAMRASPGLFIRVSLSKDKVPASNHYFIYYTCEVITLVKSVSKESGRPSVRFIPTRSLTLLPAQMEADKPAFPIGHAGLAPVP